MKFWILFLSCVSFQWGHAQEQGLVPQVETAQYAGTGCDRSDAEAVELIWLSESNRMIVLLNRAQIENSSKAFLRKNCSLSIPLTAPRGYRLVLSEPSLFGSARVEGGAEIRSRSEVFVGTEKGVEIESRVLSYDAEENVQGFFYERDQMAKATSASCDLNNQFLRMNLSFLAIKPNESSIVAGGLRGAGVTLALEPCEDTTALE